MARNKDKKIKEKVLITEEEQWHSRNIKDVIHKLDTNEERGLTTGEAKRRLEKIGFNELKETKRISPLRIFIDQFKDIFVIMLLVAVVISVALKETTDALTIAAIIVLNSTIGFFQEFRAEKAMEAMKKLTAPKARVKRDGKWVEIPAKEVVPGDIILLETGDRVPADARLIKVVDFKIDEAVLTGESIPVEKIVGTVDVKASVADRKNSIFMATHVIYGRGEAVITETGMRTEFGKIAEMVQTIEEEETPLKQKLSRFAKKLGMFIILACVLIFVIELIREGMTAENIIDVFMTAVALAVSAVPEGLPAVVTVSLALGARELAKGNAIIRKLTSAETLGAVTVICSDKTGTLTKGEMTVRKVYVKNEIVDATGVGYESEGEFLLNGKRIEPKEDYQFNLLLRIGTLCNNAEYDGKRILGDSTEGALIVASTKAGMLEKELEQTYLRLHEIPFTSERKRMTTVHKTPDGKIFAYSKGAPEIIIDRCTHYLEGHRIMNLTNKERERILKINEKMAGDALRVLAMAYKELPGDTKKFHDEDLETHLIFVGLMGMIDPPREEAKKANRLCQQAGIKTVMITGDHKLTAVAVAKELGMLKKNAMILTGIELDEMKEEDFEKIVEKVTVYARVSPEHKLRIVKALKKKGHIVAMTGDGVNDAPALKQADIGVAMGITGTDVTREAADMVLADDNFATIVTAVKGGRTIYDNIRKFSFFLIRCNFDELGIIALFALMGLELPLTAGMLLWINLITDGGPALALTMDPPEKDVMKRKPRNPKEGILYGRFASILVTFILQFVGTGGLFYLQYYILKRTLAEARTMAFLRAMLQELFVVWNCRSDRKNAFKLSFTSNKFLLFAVVASLIITIIIPYTGLFGAVPITGFDWLVVILISMTGLLILPEVFYGRKVLKWR
jgi:Ca2+-transporting ATPase